jgi:choline transport protein
MAGKILAHVSPRIFGDGPDSDSRSQSSEDRQVMEQMGKLQQLKRRFNVFSIFGLSITLLSSWEALGMSLGVSTTAGGSSSIDYGLVFIFMGSLACAASIADMASICLISSAQMHWSHMFAPKELKFVISFIQGRWFQGVRDKFH